MTMIAERKESVDKTKGKIQICGEWMTKAAIERRCKADLKESFDSCAPMPRDFWDALVLQSQGPADAPIQDHILRGTLKEYRAEPRDNGLGAVAILTDGKRLQFGWRGCIGIKTQETRLKQYLRQAVDKDKEDWKTLWLRRHGRDIFICPITGEPTNIRDSDVDHFDPQFEEIYQEFKKRSLSGLELSDLVFLRTLKPGRYLLAPPFETLGEEFRRYHAAATLIHRVDTPHLRVTSRLGNQKRGYEKRRKSTAN
jgi:hypothetical protein